MNNICFIDNFHRSKIFKSITKNLKKKNVYWITTNFFFFNKNKNIFKEKILYLNKETKSKKTNFFREQKINEIFYSDRILKKISKSYKYLEIFRLIDLYCLILNIYHDMDKYLLCAIKQI